MNHEINGTSSSLIIDEPDLIFDGHGGRCTNQLVCNEEYLIEIKRHEWRFQFKNEWQQELNAFDLFLLRCFSHWANNSW